MNISNTRVYGIAESIYASGYPMMDSPPTEEEFAIAVSEINTAIEAKKQGFTIYNKHIERMKNLGSSKLGSGHGQALIGCIVQFDLCIPVKVWVEAQRYHFLDFVSSMSTMHKIKDFKLTSDGMDASVDQRIIDILNEKQEQYNANPTSDNLLELLMNVPVGMNLTARMTTNYAQIKTMISQRKTHRLPHWHIFCNWGNALPMYKEMTERG